ncbi:MAG: hypothetical protein KC482_10030 [Dehalococcoidia bacterium]|nr:hypothetical protein [Dehalococcoidia bacterium]MCA9843354.1 hypothetical protein [Dehalococcoidia bacterium]MCA9853919.1 hypothetical protein [Dehalococcoidia bacterium]
MQFIEELALDGVEIFENQAEDTIALDSARRNDTAGEGGMPAVMAECHPYRRGPGAAFEANACPEDGDIVDGGRPGSIKAVEHKVGGMGAGEPEVGTGVYRSPLSAEMEGYHTSAIARNEASSTRESYARRVDDEEDFLSGVEVFAEGKGECQH